MSETLSSMEFAVGTNSTGSNGGIGWVTKKVRRRVDQPPELEDSTIDRNGQAIVHYLKSRISYKESLMRLGIDLSEHDRMEKEFQL